FSFSSNPQLPKQIPHPIPLHVPNTSLKPFTHPQLQINIEQTIPPSHSYLIQSTTPPLNHHIIQLLIILHALKPPSPKTLNILIPYYPYPPQHPNPQPPDPITAKLF
ncbi:ribose-phosphate pyrophosphokinase-like domain-containing protein, partial [Bacillus sp. WP8]|uniref:ribose-phosphate pyrophosphokinase-like domain-containing protein n=1 Tax=Bacillus sp. WP8 TaxID=756828 RepID=UPI001642AF6F